MGVFELQADRFRQIFNLLLEHREVVERVTFWASLTDTHGKITIRLVENGIILYLRSELQT